MSSSLATKEENDAGNSSSLSNSTDGKVTENAGIESSTSSSENTASTAWLVGDIVWSKIPGHPWWPSMVAYEPNTAVYYKYKGRTRYYHVQFFGHEPMRGWATEKSIRLYEGKDHFLSLRLSTHGKMHKVGNKQLPLWETAVKMADKAVPLNRHERKLCFTFKYNKKEAKAQVNPAKSCTEILNGIVKPKADNNGEIGLGEPKSKRKSSLSGKVCNDRLSPKNVSNSKSVAKKSKPNNDDQKDIEKHTKVKVYKKSLSKQEQCSKLKEIEKKGSDTPKPKKQVQEKADSPTTLKLKMKRIDQVSPVSGKRKLGRPTKGANFVIVSRDDPDVFDSDLDNRVKKQKIDNNGNDTKNNNIEKALEQEKSDNASDSNSTTSTDMESKTDSTRGASKQKECVCVVCEQPDNLITCNGVCNNAYHLDCLGLNCSAPEKFVCDECTSGNHTCFLCRKTTNVVQCSASSCGKFYHLECIKTANVKVDGDKFSCPLHYCNVCGPRKAGSSKRRLTCCTRCPTAYHTATCIVAGCLPITSHYLVCKRHFLADKKKAHHSHVNVNWCFVCSTGGTLICCETCPAAFHAECIDVDEIPEGHFFCRDCTTGKELLYGELVWVKLGMYRWWPAQICNPNNIPTNIQNLHHQPGEFPVQFLGSHDYYWIHRGRVFSYQEGDRGADNSTTTKYLGLVFKRAVEEAKERYAEWQKAQDQKAEKDLEKLSKKPAVYKHLKVNRYTTATRDVVDESEWSICECSVNDENPCGPDSHCLNRILLVECSPAKCPVKERCQNQCFVKRQYLDCEPFRSNGCGWGLKAKEDAKKGQFVIEYVGELISEATCRDRVTKGSDEGVQNYYMLTIDKDCIIDAGPMGNLARFMNHSCNPNCETQKWTVNGEVRVGLFAKRDIMAGEELVFDYQLDCLGNEKKKCSCGSQNCSGFLGVRPKTQHAQLQEDKKKKAELKKKKKKPKKNQVKLVHEDECFNCGDGGELIMCDKTGCSKCYHLSCLTMKKMPHGYWLCPWHFCDDCGKAATLRCCECSNSFCTAHADGQITQLKNGLYICQEHASSADVATSTDAEVNDSDVEARSITDPAKNDKNPRKNAKNLSEDAKKTGECSQNQTKDSTSPKDNSIQHSTISTLESKVPDQDSCQDFTMPAHDPKPQDSEIFTQDSEISTDDSEIPAEDSKISIQNSKISTKDSKNFQCNSYDSQNSGDPTKEFRNTKGIPQETQVAIDHSNIDCQAATTDSKESITDPMVPVDPSLPLLEGNGTVLQ